MKKNMHLNNDPGGCCGTNSECCGLGDWGCC